MIFVTGSAAWVQEVNMSFRSRGARRPKLLQQTLPTEIRGRREDRVLAAPAVPQAVAKEICCLRAYRFGGFTPAFPAQWLYGLYEIVLVTLLFVTPSPARSFRLSPT
jgi:hypothetical protein